ncbi:MAG TPA: hypothetical protein VN915_07365 [Elusimicrobiota bacterium]|nr:hypothetical protein [Elusimicrobiota bacterium]
MRQLLHRPESRERLTSGVTVPPGPVYVREPAFQAFSVLRIGFTVLPILAGADKFFHLLTDWNQYVCPLLFRVIGGHVRGFMDLVGVIEMAAGVIVAVRPRWGSVIVGLWLCGIIVNLLLVPGYYDIALRDFGLALGALSLFRLSRQYNP